MVVAFNIAIRPCVSKRFKAVDVAGLLTNKSQSAVRVLDTIASVILLAGKEIPVLTVRVSMVAVVALSMVTLASAMVESPFKVAALMVAPV